LLRGMARSELLEQVPEGELILGMLGERITASFDFYAAFQTNEEFTIRCGQEEIGKLVAGLIPPVGEHFLLGGKRWEVREIIFNQKLVLVTLSPGKKLISFWGPEGEIHTRVFQEMKTFLMSQDEPAYVDENSKLLLRAARLVAAVAGLPKFNVVFGRQSIQWFPWVGTRTLKTLSLLAKSAKITSDVDQISITYHISSRDDFLAHLREVANFKPDGIALARLMPIKAIEKFDDFVPEDLLDQANAQSRLDIPGALEACRLCFTSVNQHL